MRRHVAILICALSLAAWTHALAHHSFTAEFDADKPIKLTGTLTKVEWTNPHIWIFMDVKNADGTMTNWGFEMPGTTQLLRAGIRSTTMKVGDVLTIDARRARDGGNTANAQIVLVASSGKQLFRRRRNNIGNAFQCSRARASFRSPLVWRSREA